jgi:hypothetical protein
MFYKSFNIPLLYNLPISLLNATDNSSTVMFYKSFNIPLLYNLPTVDSRYLEFHGTLEKIRV